MGFLDKAKAAANELASKADTALGSAGLGGAVTSGGGEADRYFRDLGVLAYLEAIGRPGEQAERARILTALRELEAHGGIRSIAMQTAPPSPPPPPFASQPPATPGPVPPPPAAQPSPSQSSPPSTLTTPPPPPPSWLSTGGGA